MSKPEDIPQDVWNAAVKTYSLMVCSIPNDGAIKDHDTEMVARAILVERERCAKLAESYTDTIDVAHFIRSGRAIDVNTAHKFSGE